jgi:hypothetical protein
MELDSTHDGGEKQLAMESDSARDGGEGDAVVVVLMVEVPEVKFVSAHDGVEYMHPILC